MQTWIMVGGFLVGCCLSGGLNSVRAGDGLVSDDGWRPKGYHRQAAANRQAEDLTASSTPVEVNQQPAAAMNATKPFDWRDDLYGSSRTTSPVAAAKSVDSSAQTTTIASRWCRCEHSSICGHCGLRRPILAAYNDTPTSMAEPKTELVANEKRLPALDRLRLALDQVNDKVQQTLGQF